MAVYPWFNWVWPALAQFWSCKPNQKEDINGKSRNRFVANQTLATLHPYVTPWFLDKYSHKFRKFIQPATSTLKMQL